MCPQAASVDVTRVEPQEIFVLAVIKLVLVVSPEPGPYPGPLLTQPHLLALDSQVRTRLLERTPPLKHTHLGL